MKLFKGEPMRDDEEVVNLRHEVKKSLEQLDASLHNCSRIANRNRWHVMGETELIAISTRIVQLVAQLKVLDKGTEQITR
jgi:hypothetical protein